MQDFDRADRALFFRPAFGRALIAGLAFLGLADRAFAQPEASASLVAQHASAQQGLGIGLASMLFQTQYTAILAVDRGVSRGCKKIGGGGHGSFKALSKTGNQSNLHAAIRIYHDDACTKPYVHAVVAGEAVPPTFTFDLTETIYGVAGNKFGTVTAHLEGTRKNAGETLQFSLTGTFTPSVGDIPVAFGFTCPLPGILFGTDTFKCTSGIAQKFPALALDLAALTPQTFTTTQVGMTAAFKVTFTGAGAKLSRGAQDTLSISAPNDHTLAVTGGATAYGMSTSTGAIGRFTLFPPPPSSWTVIDAGHDAKFSIAMGASHSYSGTVKKRSTGAMLATFNVDELGNGSIKYSNNTMAKITNWTLAN